MAEVIGVGLLGCGIVGGSVARILLEHADEIAERVGARLEIRKVAVRNLAKERAVAFAPGILTNQPEEVATHPDIRILVEVMYSAKQPDAGYKHFRLIIQKSFPPGPQKK